MAKVDMNRMRRSYEENQRGGDIWNPPQGLTKLYVHGPCREDDTHELTAGTNYLAIVVHYGLGKDDAMGICLDPERNPIITHPFIQALLKKRKIKLTGKCTVCRAIDSGQLSAEEAEESRPSTRFLFGITPVMQKVSKTASWQKLTPKPQVMLVGTTIYNGIMDIFMENDDITDMNAAVFAIVGREGTGKFGTKYVVKGDPDTIKSPKKLPEAVRKLLIKVMKREGDCDLFRIVANMVKSPEELKTLLAGGKVATGKGRSRDEDTEESDDDIEDIDDTEDSDDTDDDTDLEDGDDDDPELEDGDEESDDDDTEDSDDDTEESDDDTEESDDDTEESDDDTEESDDDTEESDDDDTEDSDDDDPELEDGDDDDTEDDDEPAPPPKAKAKAGKPASKPAAKPGKDKPVTKPAKKPKADDDDLGLDELDAELEKIASKKPKPAPTKPGKKPKK